MQFEARGFLILRGLRWCVARGLGVSPFLFPRGACLVWMAGGRMVCVGVCLGFRREAWQRRAWGRGQEEGGRYCCRFHWRRRGPCDASAGLFTLTPRSTTHSAQVNHGCK